MACPRYIGWPNYRYRDINDIAIIFAINIIYRYVVITGGLIYPRDVLNQRWKDGYLIML